MSSIDKSALIISAILSLFIASFLSSNISSFFIGVKDFKKIEIFFIFESKIINLSWSSFTDLYISSSLTPSIFKFLYVIFIKFILLKIGSSSKFSS